MNKRQSERERERQRENVTFVEFHDGQESMCARVYAPVQHMSGTAVREVMYRKSEAKHSFLDTGGCQNYGPFLGPYYLRYPKWDPNFDNYPYN